MKKKDLTMYTPAPIDTSDVTFSHEISELIEALAKNTHDVWAMGRIADGWKLGEKRNDKKKTHPCLIPYEDLPESEKEYDRNTASEALKCILKLGYKIEKD